MSGVLLLSGILLLSSVLLLSGVLLLSSVLLLSCWSGFEVSSQLWSWSVSPIDSLRSLLVLCCCCTCFLIWDFKSSGPLYEVISCTSGKWPVPQYPWHPIHGCSPALSLLELCCVKRFLLLVASRKHWVISKWIVVSITSQCNRCLSPESLWDTNCPPTLYSCTSRRTSPCKPFRQR